MEAFVRIRTAARSRLLRPNPRSRRSTSSAGGVTANSGRRRARQARTSARERGTSRAPRRSATRAASA